MQKRRQNVVQTERFPSEGEPTALSLTDAKSLFLQDIKDLSRETQRWHRENLTAFEKVLAKQNIAVEDVTQLTPTFIRHKFAFYMLEEMGLKPNTINGRIRSVRAMIKFLVREGYLPNDFGPMFR